MEALSISETSMNFYQTTPRYIPEHGLLQIRNIQYLALTITQQSGSICIDRSTETGDVDCPAI
jgi:hypothetical protein